MMAHGRGLQPERTAIAWVRTGMALVVNALLLARAGMHAGPHGPNFFLLLFSAALCLGYVALFFLRARHHRLLRAGRQPLPLHEARILAGLTVLVSLGILAVWACRYIADQL